MVDYGGVINPGSYPYLQIRHGANGPFNIVASVEQVSMLKDAWTMAVQNSETVL